MPAKHFIIFASRKVGERQLLSSVSFPSLQAALDFLKSWAVSPSKVRIAEALSLHRKRKPKAHKRR